MRVCKRRVVGDLDGKGSLVVLVCTFMCSDLVDGMPHRSGVGSRKQSNAISASRWKYSLNTARIIRIILSTLATPMLLLRV
jgi:hypothetical protein